MFFLDVDVGLMGFCGCTRLGNDCCSLLWKNAIEIASFRVLKMVMFHSYVSLTDGKPYR